MTKVKLKARFPFLTKKKSRAKARQVPEFPLSAPRA